MVFKWMKMILKRPKVILYAAWALVLTGLLWDGRYQAFLRPEFGVFITLGAVIMGLMVVVEAKKEVEPVSVHSLIVLGILILPLLFFIRAQSFTLDSYALSKRATTSWQQNKAKIRPAIPPPGTTKANTNADYVLPGEKPVMPAKTASTQEKKGKLFAAASAPAQKNSSSESAKPSGPKTVASKPKAPVATLAPAVQEFQKNRQEEAPVAKSESGIPEEVSLSLLLMAPDRFIRKKISVTGMVKKNNLVKKYLGENSFVLFRFMIFCCAADAQPIAATVQTDDRCETEADSWVKVEGIFELRSTDQGPLPVIRHGTVKKIEKPGQVYLY